MVDPINPFYVMEVMAAAQKRESAGKDVLHLEVGQPSTGAPRKALEVAHQLLDLSPLGYTPSRGIPELAPAIAKHIAQTYGVEVEPQRIAVTQGASLGMVLAILAAFEPGSRIAIPEPGYACYRNILRALHMVPVVIRLGLETRYQPTVEHLERCQALDGVIVSSPSNPTGTVLVPAELERLTKWCDANEVRLISDEIYHGLTYGDAEVSSAVEFSSKAIVVNSFSKFFSMTGWRIGWLVLPDELREAVDRRAQNLVICPTALSQHVALAALSALEEPAAHLARYATNRALLLEGLSSVGLNEIAPADGAFYLWVRCDHVSGSVKLASTWLHDYGLAVTPGIDFDPTDGQRFVRFSYSGSTETIRKAVEVLRRWSAGSVVER